jgi:hypothetical protein
VKEETGLDVEITDLLSVASNFLRPDIQAVAWLAKPVGGVTRPGDDVDELGWFSSKMNCRTLHLPPIATWLSATLRRTAQARRSTSPTPGKRENRARVSNRVD